MEPLYDYADLKRWDHRALWHPFTQMREWLAEDPLIIIRGEGNYLIDVQGRKYLDGVSSLWCNVHGHNRPEINAAIAAQLEQVAHSTLLGLANAPSILLAKRLTEIAPPGLSRIFYSDSGAAAVEVGLKMAVQYWHLKGNPQKTKFASLREAYHGDTLGAVGVGYSEVFHHFFRPLLFECFRLTPPHLFRFRDRMGERDALTRALAEAEVVLGEHRRQIAALIVEPLMQGAAGMWAQPRGYVRALGEIARANDILFICDEVATGFGRTGKMFACEHEGVSPDILCLGKGTSGGYLPLAATLATEEIFSAFLGRYDEFKTFFHGHTYTGNPLACAAGIASLDIFEKDGVLETMGPKLAFLAERLQADLLPLTHVADIRQWGFMVGIELMPAPEQRLSYGPAEQIGARVTREARRRGVILRPLGNVLVLMPPLSVSTEELASLVEVARESIRAITEA